MFRKKVLLYKDLKMKKPKSKWPKNLAIAFGVALVALFIAVLWQHMQEKSNFMSSKETEQTATPPALKPPQKQTINVKEVPNALEYKIREEYTFAAHASQIEAENDYFDNALFVGDEQSLWIKSYMTKTFPNIKLIADDELSLKSFSTESMFFVEGEAFTLAEELEKCEDVNNIYILVGGKDLELEPEEFAEKYNSLLKLVKETQPNAKIFVQSIPPVNEEKLDKTAYPNRTNARIDEYNFIIMDVAHGQGCYYLDIAAAFIDDVGQLPTQASPDGVQFIGEYYYRWFDYLKKHIV